MYLALDEIDNAEEMGDSGRSLALGRHLVRGKVAAASYELKPSRAEGT